ncbi:MAG: PKD domain-containing protein, partial [Ornithinimicrobium sp.]
MKLLRRPRLLASVVIATVAMSGMGASAQATGALPTQAPQGTSHDRTVSDVPADWTPRIEDGTVYSIAQAGDSMVVGGDFSTVAPSSGSPTMGRANVFAFDASNGQINPNFTPVPDGEVRAVEPGPTPGTIYVGGAFKGIDGQGGKIHLLNVSDGSIVSSFSAPGMNGAVQDLVLLGDRLYVAGVFTKVGGQPFGGLVALDAATGQRQDFMSVSLTENHNYTGQPGQARAPVGAKAFAIDAAGTQMSVIGNFKKADGLDRDQMVMIDLTGATAEVRSDWRTRDYEATCASRAFDTYMRDVDFAPDGSYVTVATTGGPFSGTLCDTLTRWDVADTGDDVKPEWTDATGGDTLLSVATSGAAIYTGGHQRWMNNPNGRDSAGAGAVPRAGLGGVDPDNGVPVSWNPGRHPRGVGAEAITVTEAGLWVGSDTEFIGNFRYRRPRLAFFPVEGGIQQGPGETGDLPSNVYLVNNKSTESNVLFRINAAGPELPAFDGGPSWAADNFDDSAFRNSGSRAATWSAVPTVGDDVPAGTPSAIFDSERWDPSGGEELSWDIPVADGEEVSVRLYFASRCGCTNDPGERIMNVDLEGDTVLSVYDIVADVGHDTGTMKEFDVTSDGNIDIDLRHLVENPLINGIEIVSDTPAGEPMPDGPGLSRVYYEGGAATGEPQAAPSGDIPWSDVRGAVLIDGELFYGTQDREFFRRSFDGEDFGDAEAIDPYNDPEWADVETGSGSSVYRGVKPSFYNEIAGMVGMSFQDDRLYYTRSGSSALHSRAFVPESGVISDKATQVAGFNASNVAGIFFDSDGDALYYANSSTGTLSRIGWDDGAVSGGATVVSGPDIDGVDWRSRVLFLGPGPEPVVNQTPIADIADPVCDGLVCEFDGSGSSDPDDGDSVASYSWDYGDGQTDTGATPSHEFAGEGSYEVTLTVADQDGAEGSTTVTVDVQAAPD